jgi:hypothetical protein
MTPAEDAATNPPAEPLQFDHAEFTAPPQAVACGICTRPIADAYYELGQKVLCTTCRDGIVARFSGGSGLWRFCRAALFGSLAGLAGTALYFLVLAVTGYQVGLIAILVGLMVGGAVRKGARYRGGLAYQALAVFLTYTAIVASYVPGIYGALTKRSDEKLAAVAAADPAQPLQERNVNPDPAKEVHADAPRRPAPAAAPKIDTGRPIRLLILGLVALALAYAWPFLEGARNLIGLLIIFFGLLQAWRMNKKLNLRINGPFRVGEAPPPLVEAPAHA